ncbi:MAG: hypothetical protein ACREC0_04840, partial [Methylocella sp.]
GGQEGELRFLNIKTDVPEDLSRAFRAGAQSMPRARLGDGSWQLEDDRLAALRAKIKAGRKTLGEVYGAPLYGIKTGLNVAFVVSRERRDELVARDARSAELLVPFLRGENIKRWRVESEDLFLINIPKGKSLSRKLAPNRSPHPEEPRSGVSKGAGASVATGGASFETPTSWAPQDEDKALEARSKFRIDDFPAIRDHLLPFKDKLEARATKQEWFELQQAQLAYQPIMKKRKLIWPHFQATASFCMDDTSVYLNNKAFFISDPPFEELGFLNSKPAWFLLAHLARIKRGGYLEAEAQYVEQLPSISNEEAKRARLGEFAEQANSKAMGRNRVIDNVLRRIPDLCPPDRTPKLTTRLQEWWKLDFKSFQAAIKKAFKTDIPLKQRHEWENFLRDEGEKVRRLTAEIEQAERESDAIVFKLFDLTPDEIALLESSLAGQY